MEDGQTATRDNHQGSLEDHERDLLVCQLPIEAAAQLGHPVDGADEDADRGRGQS